MNEYLYMWEGIACIAVMMIHCLLPDDLGPLMRVAARFGVPLFFAVSGRYLVLQWENTSRDAWALRGILKKRIRRTFVTTLFVVAVHTLYSLIWYLARGESLSAWLQAKYAPAEWLRLLLFNTGGVISDGSVLIDHLWYLFALLYVFILLYFTGDRLIRHARFLVPPLLVCYYLGLHYRNRIHYAIGPFSTDGWYILRNWFLPGLLFVLLGAWLAHVDLGRKGLLLALAGFPVMFLEYMRYGTRDCYLGSLFTLIGALAGSVPRVPSRLVFLGRHCSRHVYYWHMMVYSLLIWFFWILPGDWHARHVTGWLLPLGTYGVSILLAAFLSRRRPSPGL